MADERLQSIYAHYNQLYFGSKLPDVECDYKSLGKTFGQVYEEDDKLKLELNAIYAHDGRVERMTLLHEMQHVALWPYRGHGNRFQLGMLRLAAAGAFEKLW